MCHYYFVGLFQYTIVVSLVIFILPFTDLFRILTSFLDHLMDYYSALVKTLQQQCGFELSVLTGDNTSSSTMDDSFSSKTHHRKVGEDYVL